MELYRKGVLGRIVYPFAGAVVGVHPAQGAAAGLNGIIHYRVAVVLTGDIGAPGLQVFYRLVYDTVTVFQLFRHAAHSQRQQLVPQANAKNRRFADELFQLSNGSGVLCRISGTVRQHNAVRVQR